MSLTYSHLSGSIVVLGSITASGGFSGSVTVDGTSIDHNSLNNYESIRHIDHSAVSINAGLGLTGGGTIQSDRSLALDGTSGYFTSSVQTVISSNNFATTSSVQSLTDQTSSYAITGSNIFSGSQNITGSLILTGSADIDGDINATGDITAYYSSDERLKENIIRIQSPSNKIKLIHGVEFDWVPKKGIHNNKGHDIGVIAQDIEKILPDIVVTKKNGYKAVNYEKLVALLIEVNKDLLKRVEELERNKL